MGKKISTTDFIEQCKTIHNNKYDYLKTTYNGCNNNIIVKSNKSWESNLK